MSRGLNDRQAEHELRKIERRTEAAEDAIELLAETVDGADEMRSRFLIAHVRDFGRSLARLVEMRRRT